MSALGNQPAYPVTNQPRMLGTSEGLYSSPGMTLRQCYAMAAMQGAISARIEASEAEISEVAFRFADAMLAYEDQEQQSKGVEG